MIKDALRATSEAAPHPLPASPQVVFFILICIEVDSAFLRDGPVDGERPASHDATRRMLAALQPKETPRAAA